MKRTTQRRSEHLEKAAHGVCASDHCDSTRNHEEVTGNSSSKNNVRREQRKTNAEEHRDKQYHDDSVLQRLYAILPKPNEQQLVLEDRYGSATHESVKRRANN